MVLFPAIIAFADDKVREKVRQHQPKMSFLDNGIIKLGVDLNLGGSITYLSRSGVEENMVNSWDFGRQIQMSYYSGPVPFAVGGKQPRPEWIHIGWNPIQVGDAFGNPSRIVEHKNDGKHLYVKCVPMHWPLDNVPGECIFESWLELEGNVVRARSRIVNNRPDHTQWPARGQELPAVYTNGPWYKLYTYTGSSPFTGGKLSRIEHPFTMQSPWATFLATEHWAALVNDNDFGLGVFNPNTIRFGGGFAGKPGQGGAHDNPTGYLAPNDDAIIDWNITHEYRYDLIVGSLEQIRKHVYAHASRYPNLPVWKFEKDRVGWRYTNATDTGWPIKGELVIDLSQHNPQVTSPFSLWKAEDAGTLVIEAAAQVTSPEARVYWRGIDDPGFSGEKSQPFKLTSGNDYQTYRIPLAGAKGWSGSIVQVRVDPDLGPAVHPGDWIRLKSVRFEK